MTTRRTWAVAGALLLAVLRAPALAQEAQVVDLPTRPGVQLRMLVVRPAADVSSVLVLLTGGGGQLGIYPNGSMRRDGNFLVRSRQLFVSHGHAVVLLDTPSDQPELRGSFRDSAEHAQDLGAAVAWARRSFGKQVWLVGTSRGTHSAANGALRLRDEQAPDGLVLTSTILDSARFGNVTAIPVQQWPLHELRMPVLVVHHQDDACQVCPPARLPELMARLNPGTSQLVTYAGGRSQGPACEAFAHHGFNGLEERVVADISGWIRSRP
ncbi:MAG TPA: alpha/beta hydrolase [Ramlibacter sp.]|uniref:alpha/beta hydrolase n=1 Tax=Ramlibacter sp. TaxID=1917967 RepID=UPI002D349278|nr:alpha/beta hydrolase [Ramlibacter sp.]HZY20632.1 alpha/beta hydrolase [Ramlibacter sp.]